MEYQDPDDKIIEENKQDLPISWEKGGAIVPSQPSPVESLDALIAESKSAEEIKELLGLRDIALRQKYQEEQIKEIQKQRENERRIQEKKENIMTISSIGVIAIGLGIMYSSSPLVGTFILILGIATLLGIPFNELYDEFINFVEKTYEKLTKIFPFKP